MGIGLGGILGKVTGLDKLFDSVTEVAKQVLPDPKARMDFELKVHEIRDREIQRLHEQLQGQIEVNKIEAGHASLFVAGWRPFIGWVGGTAVAYSFIVAPLFEFVARSIFDWKGNMPMLDTAPLITLILALLGIAGFRSVDKAKGVATSALGEQPSKIAVSATSVDTDDEEAAPWTK